MPLSCKSSSLCFLTCMCSALAAHASEAPVFSTPISTLIGAQDNKHTTFSPPAYNTACSDCLKSSFILKDVCGTQFPTSFFGSINNFVISGHNKTISLYHCQAPATNGAALISANDTLTISNLAKLEMDANIATGQNGLISGNNIVIKNCKTLIFNNNQTPYTPVVTTDAAASTTTVNTACGSVLHTTNQINITNIRKNITFNSNVGNFGSAILNTPSTTCNIFNNKSPILFSQNYSSCGGGAIYDGTITFTGNTQAISFLENIASNDTSSVTPAPTANIAGGCGGAICSPTKSVEFSQNTGPIKFAYNASGKDGGAIYASSCTLNTQALLSFDKNTAIGNGGAICARALTLNTKGNTLFSNNRANKGGAIYLSSTVGDTTNASAPSTLTVTAEQGNLIFIGNRVNAQPGVRNAIQIDEDAKVASLSAANNSKIIFYDPIVNTGKTTYASQAAADAITINTAGNQGSVIFSGSRVQSSEKMSSASTISSLFGNVTVASGQLVVTDNATLNVLGLTANDGTLVLGSGAQVGMVNNTAANAPAKSNFAIGRLGIDIASFLTPTYQTAAVNSGTGNTITLTGSLSLISEDDSRLYDNTLFTGSLAIPTITFSSNNNGAPTVSGFTAGAMSVGDHYGYQGTWQSSWTAPMLTPTPSQGVPSGIANRTLYAIWAPTTKNGQAVYLLDPERRGELVPNSLWSTFFAARSFSNNLVENLLTNREGCTISGKTLGNYTKQNPQRTNDGFSGRHGGYQTDISICYPYDLTFGVAFGQLYGQIKSQNYNAKNTEHITLLGLFGKLPLIPSYDTSVSWEATYTYATNTMHTQYATHLPDAKTAKAMWYNHTYYVKVSLHRPIYSVRKCITKNRFKFSGFLSGEFTNGQQSACQEQGQLTRRFSHGRGHNIALPVGCFIEWFSPFKGIGSTTTLLLSYTPDIYRVNPHTTMTIVANNQSFHIPGVAPVRNSLSLRLHNDIEVSKYLSGYATFACNSRAQSETYHFAAGLKGMF